MWADLINKGYFTDPSTDLFAEAPRLFNQGKVAMVPCGSWYLTVLTGNGVPESKCDIFVMPPHNASAGKVVILEASPDPDLRQEPPTWRRPRRSPTGGWARRATPLYAKLVKQYPANSKADTSYLPAAKVELPQDASRTRTTGSSTATGKPRPRRSARRRWTSSPSSS